MKNILVLCTGNSCRSQMAEGYLRFFANNETAVYSAGIETHGLNPGAVLVMGEDGVDISTHTSNNVEEFKDIAFDYVLTVCDHARENCPWFPTNAKRIHCSFPDPAKATGTPEERLNEFRRVRNSIKDYCQNFVKSLGLAKME